MLMDSLPNRGTKTAIENRKRLIRNEDESLAPDEKDLQVDYRSEFPRGKDVIRLKNEQI